MWTHPHHLHPKTMPNNKSSPEPENVTQQETGGDCVSRLVRILRCREDDYGTDYIVDLERPDGSVVSVLIPKEGSDNHSNRVVITNDPENPFGLNLVCDGHYA